MCDAWDVQAAAHTNCIQILDARPRLNAHANVLLLGKGIDDVERVAEEGNKGVTREGGTLFQEAILKSIGIESVFPGPPFLTLFSLYICTPPLPSSS